MGDRIYQRYNAGASFLSKCLQLDQFSQGDYWSGTGYQNATGAGFGGADGQGDSESVGNGASWTPGFGFPDNTGTGEYGAKAVAAGWGENDARWEENE